MDIRPAEPRDWPAVLAINREGTPGVAALDARELAILAADATYFRIAAQPGLVLGYCLAFGPESAYRGEEFLWFQRHARGTLYIDQVATSEGARRRGVGSSLYRDVAGFAFDRGLRALSCEINLRPHNPVSLRFHERLGFRPVGSLETGDGRTVSLQVLDLGRRPLPEEGAGRRSK
jgi:uncharacterized protein